MHANHWPKQVNRNDYYGNPALPNGRLNPGWESNNLVRVAFPWVAVLAWDVATRVRTARIHQTCADSLARVLRAIWNASGNDQEVINSWGMHLYGGGFEFRPVRGGKALSSHSWGCAIDFDPVRNGYKDSTPNFANVPAVLKAFADEGWTWGGNWSPCDGMHWQAATVR